MARHRDEGRPGCVTEAPSLPATTRYQIMHKMLTAIIEREDHGDVSLCPELDIASQGDSIAETRDNLREALELFFKIASPREVQQRL